MCAYDLYDFENPDLCSKYDARKNGSLKHVDGKLLHVSWYSDYSKMSLAMVRLLFLFSLNVTSFLYLIFPWQTWFLFSVKFCQTYSYNKNGPCQNGGTLKDTGDLAIDAKCECKDGYSGNFCDIVNKVCTCILSAVLR